MFNKNWIMTTVFAIGALTACVNTPSVPGSPKRRLEEYISRSFAVKSAADRQQLVSYLTGDAKGRLASWSDEQFLQAFMDSKRQFLKLALSEVKPISKDQVDITYELSYVDQGKGHDARVTNKKLCQMVRENGQWMIKDVHNIKELVEYSDEMSLP